MGRLFLTAAAAVMFTTTAPASGTRIFMHYIPTSTAPLVQQEPNGWQYVINDPNTCGVQIVVPWSDVETSKGVYDWNDLDFLVDQWAAKGKYAELTFTGVAENVNQERGFSNGSPQLSTPAYVMNAGEQIIQCKLPTPVPPTPDYLDSRYYTPWRSFIAAAVAHYGRGNPNIAALHFDVGAGESAPVAKPSSACNAAMNNANPSINGASWEAYAIATVDYVASLRPQVQVFRDLQDTLGNKSFMPDMAAEANRFGMGVGNDGFGFNWATQGLTELHTAFFEQGGPLYPYHPLWYAETASVANQGALNVFPSILAEATDLGIHTLHIYAQEWSVAHNPSDINYAKYHGAYQTAFSSVAPVQARRAASAWGNPDPPRSRETARPSDTASGGLARRGHRRNLGL
jgi:hypothetical protein